MRAYLMDLRERVVAAVDGGMSQEQAAAVFGVSVNTIGRYLARRRVTGAWPRRCSDTGRRRRGSDGCTPGCSAGWPPRPDATLAEHAAAFAAEQGLRVSLMTMSRAIASLPAEDPVRR